MSATIGGNTTMRQTSSIGLACGGLLALAAAIGIGRFVYTPILPVMLESLHWSKADAGLLASSNFLGYLVGAMIAAWPVAAHHQRMWLLATLLVSALTTAGMALDDQLVTLMGLRFVGGAASAFVIVLSSTLVLDRLATAQRADLSAIHFAGVGVGIIVSAALVSVMVAAGAEWQALWIGSGAISLLATVLVAVLIPEQAQLTSSAPMSADKRPPRGLPALIVAYGLFGFGYVITATFLVAIVRMTPEVRTLEAWIWILFGLATLPSVALWSWIGARIGLLIAFSVACLVEAFGVAASVEWISMSGVCLSAILLGGTFMGITALGLMASRQLSGSQPQRAIALMTASFATGQMIGPTVAGILFDKLGSLTVPSIIAAAALLLAAALAITADRSNATP
jgi:predicted MFS family arabinose efflux permease